MAIRMEIQTDHGKYAQGSVHEGGQQVVRYRTMYDPMDGGRVSWYPWMVELPNDVERFATYDGACSRVIELTFAAFTTRMEAARMAQVRRDLDRFVDEVTR
jgi:hypothetical protein